MSTAVHARATLLVLTTAVGAFALTACDSSSTATSATVTVTGSLSAVATTSVDETSTASSPPSAGLGRRAAALAAWKQGAEANAAELDRYLDEAATDLSAAVSLGVPDPASYRSAVVRIRQLETVPETDTTAAQRSTVRDDTVALNAFFGTPGLYGFPAS